MVRIQFIARYDKGQQYTEFFSVGGGGIFNTLYDLKEMLVNYSLGGTTGQNYKTP